MRLLLDTHSLLWWLLDSASLSKVGRKAIADNRNEVLTSAASFYELHFKARRNRLPISSQQLAAGLTGSGLTALSISIDHAIRAAQLDWSHRDPWDRILAAQAQLEQAVIVSRDVVFDQIELPRVW